MKNFAFESILLMSHRERRARQITFHKAKNLIVGRNHTGKSSLIKTLFRTLGARPAGELKRWDENAVSLVSFSVDERNYKVIHQRGHRALLDENDRLLAAASSHAEWAEAFAKATGFNLFLMDKSGEIVSADPRCFFIPFYVDQDGSWQSTWNTFAGLQQYKAPVRAILEYFTGVKPPEYYEASAKRATLAKTFEELERERHSLEKARERFSKSLALSGPKVAAENFDAEIKRLTAEVSDLNRRQEILREKAVKEQELVASIGHQIDLARSALATYESDARFLRDQPGDNLTCPTCGAEHAESFLDVLTFAEDARILRELAARLEDDGAVARKQYAHTAEQVRALEGSYARVNQILEVRRGELEFRDVVNSMGAEEAQRAFREEEERLDRELAQLLIELEHLDRMLRNLSSKQRAKTILEAFRATYAAAMHGLNLPPMATANVGLTARPAISGSAGPRAILAYYAAIWATCRGAAGAFNVPLVIDSPNQQGQDDINLPKVLAFIATRLPQESQIIVGSEIDTDEQFDKRIVLDRQYNLLLDSEYSLVAERLSAPLDLLYATLRDGISKRLQ